MFAADRETADRIVRLEQKAQQLERDLIVTQHSLRREQVEREFAESACRAQIQITKQWRDRAEMLGKELDEARAASKAADEEADAITTAWGSVSNDRPDDAIFVEVPLFPDAVPLENFARWKAAAFAENNPAGDPRFHALLKQIGELHAKKSHDYGSAPDPFANIRSVEDSLLDLASCALIALVLFREEQAEHLPSQHAKAA